MGTVYSRHVLHYTNPTVGLVSLGDEDVKEFETAYKQTLEACHACHTAVGMPFLRPKVPTSPASTIINLEATSKPQ